MSALKLERREARLVVDWPVAMEKILSRAQLLPLQLQGAYERVESEPSRIGKRFAARLADVSPNGGFLIGEPLPLLSRVAMVIDVPDWEPVEAIGWVMWRRLKPTQSVGADGPSVALPAGFGVLFEWISMEARIELSRRIAEGRSN